MTPFPLSRRTVVAGLAVLAAPNVLRAQTDPLGPALERARGLDQLRSIQVAVDGETRLAEAVRGPALDRAANIKSVSKTIVATLTGIAIDRGVISGPDATLGEVAPGLVPRGADPRVGALTMADLLTMQAGLERTSGANYGAWVSSRNWVADALSRPFVAEPGAGMLYSTGSYHVLGAALSVAAGQSLLALARDWLGRPLGIEIPAWTRDPQGYYMGGNDMAMTPRGLLRFAEMIRQGGVWDRGRVVSADWIAASMVPRTRSRFSGHDYGYGWFLANAGGVPLSYGRGYGGQMVYVIPERRASVVVTSDPNRPARSDGHVGALNRLLAEAILPAI